MHYTCDISLFACILLQRAQLYIDRQSRQLDAVIQKNRELEARLDAARRGKDLDRAVLRDMMRVEKQKLEASRRGEKEEMGSSFFKGGSAPAASSSSESEESSEKRASERKQKKAAAAKKKKLKAGKKKTKRKRESSEEESSSSESEESSSSEEKSGSELWEGKSGGPNTPEPPTKKEAAAKKEPPTKKPGVTKMQAMAIARKEAVKFPIAKKEEAAAVEEEEAKSPIARKEPKKPALSKKEPSPKPESEATEEPPPPEPKPEIFVTKTDSPIRLVLPKMQPTVRKEPPKSPTAKQEVVKKSPPPGSPDKKSPPPPGSPPESPSKSSADSEEKEEKAKTPEEKPKQPSEPPRLALDLQAVIVRPRKPAIVKQPFALVQEFEEEKDMEITVKVTDIKTLAEENEKLHVTVASLERKLSLAMGELRAVNAAQARSREQMDLGVIARRDSVHLKKENEELKKLVEELGEKVATMMEEDEEFVVPRILVQEARGREGPSVAPSVTAKFAPKKAPPKAPPPEPGSSAEEIMRQAVRIATLERQLKSAEKQLEEKRNKESQHEQEATEMRNTINEQREETIKLAKMCETSTQNLMTILRQSSTDLLTSRTTTNASASARDRHAAYPLSAPPSIPDMKEEPVRFSEHWHEQLESAIREFDSQFRETVIRLNKAITEHGLRSQLQSAVSAERQKTRKIEMKYETDVNLHIQRAERQAEAIARLEQEVNSLRRRVARANEADRLESEIAELKLKKEGSDRRIEELLKEMEANAKYFDQCLESAKKELDNVINERHELTHTVLERTEESEKLRTDLAVLSTLLHKAEATIIELSPETRDQFIDVMAEKAKSTNAQIDALTREGRELKKREGEGERLRGKLVEELDGTKRGVRQLEEMITSLRKELTGGCLIVFEGGD